MAKLTEEEAKKRALATRIALERLNRSSVSGVNVRHGNSSSGVTIRRTNTGGEISGGINGGKTFRFAIGANLARGGGGTNIGVERRSVYIGKSPGRTVEAGYIGPRGGYNLGGRKSK